MRTFTLTINTSNDAFASAPGFEVARVLRRVADQVEDWQFDTVEHIAMDANGNRCGMFGYTDKSLIDSLIPVVNALDKE